LDIKLYIPLHTEYRYGRPFNDKLQVICWDVRSNLYFLKIPFKFLCRDDWADIHVQGENATISGVDTQRFERASNQERKPMLENVRKFELDEEQTDDEEEEEEEDNISDDEDDDDIFGLQKKSRI
jgi:hypothetical protein